MKRYLKEIEISGMILMLIGSLGHRFMKWDWAIWMCAIGLVLWVITLIYKAFHWSEYQRENRQNILIMLLAILLIYIIILMK